MTKVDILQLLSPGLQLCLSRRVVWATEFLLESLRRSGLLRWNTPKVKKCLSLQIRNYVSLLQSECVLSSHRENFDRSFTVRASYTHTDTAASAHTVYTRPHQQCYLTQTHGSSNAHTHHCLIMYQRHGMQQWYKQNPLSAHCSGLEWGLFNHIHSCQLQLSLYVVNLPGLDYSVYTHWVTFPVYYDVIGRKCIN